MFVEEVLSNCGKFVNSDVYFWKCKVVENGSSWWFLSHVFMQCFTFESSFCILYFTPNAVLMTRLVPQTQTPSQTAVKPLISIAQTATGKEAVAPPPPGGQLWALQAQPASPGHSGPVTSQLVWPYANRRRRRTRGAKLCLTVMSSQLTSRTRRYSSYDIQKPL